MTKCIQLFPTIMPPSHLSYKTGRTKALLLLVLVAIFHIFTS